MRRADRLFQIVQFLRGRRLTTAGWLAGTLDVSVRTVYRDVRDLLLAGVPVEGEAGLGYALRRKLDLPPLNFDAEELSALHLGLRFSMGSLPGLYALPASTALAKIRSILPAALAEELESQKVFVPQRKENVTAHFDLLDKAIRRREALALAYRDAAGKASRRVVHPLGLFYQGRYWTFLAWDEAKDDFRNFRMDRIESLQATGRRFRPEPGRTLEDFFGRMRKEFGLPRSEFDPDAA